VELGSSIESLILERRLVIQNDIMPCLGLLCSVSKFLTDVSGRSSDPSARVKMSNKNNVIYSKLPTQINYARF
jgi:hypothetical protein